MSTLSNESVQTLIDVRLDRYDYYRQMIHHPVEGMAAKGFTQEEIQAALDQIDVMQDFYEDLAETL